jgi:hypothetical protein
MSNVDTNLRTFLLLVVLVFLVAWVVVGHAESAGNVAPLVNADALLKKSDSYRNGWPSYTLRVKITNFESGKSDEERLYEVSQKGTDRTYVEFMSPREKGRHLLMSRAPTMRSIIQPSICALRRSVTKSATSSS